MALLKEREHLDAGTCCFMPVSVSESGRFFLTRTALLMVPCPVVFWQKQRRRAVGLLTLQMFTVCQITARLRAAQLINTRVRPKWISWQGERTSRPTVRSHATKTFHMKPIVVKFLQRERKFMFYIYINCLPKVFHM